MKAMLIAMAAGFLICATIVWFQAATTPKCLPDSTGWFKLICAKY